jgi:Tfp pilus assembly protein PilP
LERGFTCATSPEDLRGWVVGFCNEQSDELAKLPEMRADAQVARWQSKYGRDPTDQQRSWLVNKIRTDIAMIGT